MRPWRSNVAVPEDVLALAGDGLCGTARVIIDEMERRGIDYAPLLDAVGLRPPSGWWPMARAPRGAVLAFVELCLAASGDPALHVTATRSARVGIFEIADFLLMMSPTAGWGFRAAGERFEVVNSGVRFRFEELGGPEGDVVATLVATHDPLPYAIESECTFVACEQRLRLATGGAHGLSRVDFSHADRGAGPAMREVFECEVRFERPADGFVLRRAAWEAPMVFRHPSVEQIVRAAVPEPISRISSDFLDRVRVAIDRGLVSGETRAETVARGIGVSQRSMQRRLAEHGTTFARLLGEARREAAIQLLSSPGARATSVARLLGFSEPGAFTRAFRRWTGRAPSDFKGRGDAPGR